MITSTTNRGFRLVEHVTYPPEPGQPISRVIQESSAIGEYDDAMTNPGSSFLWVGDNRLHLNREEVRVLVEKMQGWLAAGRIPLDKE